MFKAISNSDTERGQKGKPVAHRGSQGGAERAESWQQPILQTLSEQHSVLTPLPHTILKDKERP